ncbi:MAG: multidrug efflux RND transporter permease subunit [Victivallales bacterium]|nr:multidrug efflux RND transporter permease subunit [Victivallales bacterium]
MISLFFIERPRFAFVISIVFIIAGLISIQMLPVAQYPDITPSQVQITASYPGADAETVLKTVVQPIESQVNGVKRMIYLSSTSADDGSAVITATFGIGTDGDLNTVNVQNRASIAEPSLPSEVRDRGITVKEKSSNMLLVISLSSPDGTYDSLFLSNYLYINIQDEIARITGVGDTGILGAANYAMRIWLDPAKMANMQLTIDDITNAIKSQNTQVPAGALGEAPCPPGQDFRYGLLVQGRLETIQEFENIVIRSLPDGSNVKIKDIARVELGGENYSSSSTVNSKPGALLAVFQLSDANGLEIAEKCKAKLEELKHSFPKGVEYGIQYDTTRFIQASVKEVVETLFIAVLLVILVTYLFLQDVRSTMIPTIAIPVSLIGTFAFLNIAGYSINLITLFGLILAIGIVVDDAIVVIENVNRLMEEEDLDPKEAAKKTMMQVTGPVIATTLVLLAMFIPVCFLPGITGEMYRQFGITISVSVLISSVNALTLSPALCATILRKKSKEQKPLFIFVWFNNFFNALTHGYGALVSSLLRKSVLVMIMYIAMMGVAYKLNGWLPTGFIPTEDLGAFMVNVQLPDAASLPRTEAVLKTAIEEIKKTPGVSDVMATSGYSILNSTHSSSNALIIAVLDDWSKRKKPSEHQTAIVNSLRKKLYAIPGAMVSPFEVPSIPGIGTTGGFSFVIEDTTGVNPGRLEHAMNAIVVAANQRPELSGVFSTYRANVPRVFLKVDREKALKLGVPVERINNALTGYQGSYYVNDFNRYGKVFKVLIQADVDFRRDVRDLDNVYVLNNNDEMVPLSTLVEVEASFGPQYMNRYNLYSSVTINGNPAPGYSSGQAMATMEELAKETLPIGMKYEWTDMSYQEKLAGNQAIIVFALALTFIYLFLVAQYESWMIPLAVMLSVPVAFFGSLVFLWLLKETNNIYTQVGFVLLFGLACKTAILIVEFAKKKHEEGMGIIEAAIFAAKLRFRAVIMTAVSFILGVFPLVIASGAGAASRRSLGTAVFGGMLVSCILGTILVPSFYVIIQWLIDKTKGGKKNA